MTTNSPTWISITTPYSQDKEIIAHMDDGFVGCECEQSSSCSTETCLCVRLSQGLNYTLNQQLHAAPSLSDSYQKPILECHSNCGCRSAHCTNRVINGSRTEPELAVFDSGYKGLGLRTLSSISRGSYVCEYLGEIISTAEAHKRLAGGNYCWCSKTVGTDCGCSKTGDTDCRCSKTEETDCKCSNLGGTYLITVNEYFAARESQWFIDARSFGSIARYINHSCEPNLASVIVRVGCDIPRLALFAAQDISANEELTFSYASQNSKLSSKPCLCGSKTCKMYMPCDPIQGSTEFE